jgi:hypothetical protein
VNLDASVVGQLLQDVPLGAMIENLGLAIATAQERLDSVAIEATLRLANTNTTLLDADGKTVTRSLLELGFTPTFYQFTEATLEVSFIASMQVAEALGVGFGLRVGGQLSSPDQAAAQLAELAREEESLAGEMTQNRERIAKEREDILSAVREQKEDFQDLLNNEQGKEQLGGGGDGGGGGATG